MMKIVRTLPEEILLKFCDLNSKRDLEGIIKLFTKNAMIWGTGKDECGKGSEEIAAIFKRCWEQSEKFELNLSSNIICNENNPIWAAAIFTAHVQINGEMHIFPNLRATIVLELEDGEWKMAHQHASFPDAGQRDGDSFPAN